MIFKFVQEVFGRFLPNVIAIIGDGGNVYRAVSYKVKNWLIVHASRRIQLAIKNILLNEEAIVTPTHKLMTKLQTLLQSGELWRHAPRRS